jgi:hypothetical protein
MLYLPCKRRSHTIFMTTLTLVTNSLNDGGFSNVSGLMPTRLNCLVTNPLKCKRITRSIYIFTVTEILINHCTTMIFLKKTQELWLWHDFNWIHQNFNFKWIEFKYLGPPWNSINYKDTSQFQFSMNYKYEQSQFRNTMNYIINYNFLWPTNINIVTLSTY